MRLKNLVISVVVLAAIAAWFIWKPASTQQSSSDEDPRIGKAIVTADDIRNLAVLNIHDNNQSVRLHKTEDDIWRVESQHNLPVDFSKLSRLSQDLMQINITRYVTDNPQRIERIDFTGSISLQADSAETILQIDFARSSDGTSHYVRYGADQPLYQIERSIFPDATPANWTDKTPIEFQAEEVQSISIQLPPENEESGEMLTLEFSRSTTEDDFQLQNSNLSETQKAEHPRIERWVNTLIGLRFQSTTDSSDTSVASTMENTRTHRIRTFDGSEWTILLAQSQDEENPKAYAKIHFPQSDKAWSPVADTLIFEINTYSHNQQPNRDELLKTNPVTE